MSAATPVIFDDGSKALVSQENLSAALKDGGKVAQAMQFDDGSKAYVTLDKVHDAIHDGGMLMGTPPQPPAPPAEAGPISQAATTFGAKLADMGNAVASSGSTTPQQRIANLGRPPQNPIATKEGDTAMNVGATAANLVPLAAGLLTGHGAEGAAEGEGAASAGAKAAASAVPEAVKAALTKLPKSLIQRVPYVGDVLTDVYKAGAQAYQQAKVPPVYPGAPLPEHPGTFPGAPLPETPTPELLQSAPLARGATPGQQPPAATLAKIPVPKFAGEGPVETPATAQPAAPAAAAPTPTGGAEIYRDATLNKRNIPEYAGEEIPEAKLPEATGSVIDQAIPPKGESYGANLRTKAQVEFALMRGDVAGAEAAMDQAAAEANPAYKPPANRAAPTAKPPVAELPTFHDPNLPPHPYANPPQGVTPSVQNIRENEAMSAAAEAEPNRPTPDSMEDRAISQEMQWNLEREGYAAESQARREFIARNSTGVTKGELVKKAQQAASGQPPGDLSTEWQKALDAINAGKGKQ